MLTMQRALQEALGKVWQLHSAVCSQVIANLCGQQMWKSC